MFQEIGNAITIKHCRKPLLLCALWSPTKYLKCVTNMCVDLVFVSINDSGIKDVNFIQMQGEQRDCLR